MFQIKSILSKDKENKYQSVNTVDSSRSKINQSIIDRWSSAFTISAESDDDDDDDDDDDKNNNEKTRSLLLHNLRNKFVTGNW